MFQALLLLCFITTAHYSVSMQPPQSLCAFLGLQDLEEGLQKSPTDVKKLLAQRVIGPAGWWYLDKQLGHGPVLCNSVTFSDDNELLAVGYETAGVKVWNNNDNVVWNKDERMSDEKGMYTSVAFKPGTQLLALACGTPALPGWNLKTCKAIARKDDAQNIIQSGKDVFYFVAFSKDGSHVLTKSGTGTFNFWNSTGSKIANFEMNDISDACIMYDNSLVAFVGQSLFLWHSIHNAYITTVQIEQAGYRAVACHPHKKLLVTISPYKPKFNEVWDCSGNALIKQCALPKESYGKNPWAVEFHPHKDIFAIGYQENGIIFYSLYGERLLRIPYEYHDPFTGVHKVVQDIAFNAKGTKLAAACNNGVVPIWRQYEQPTIAHVLLRMVFKRYYKQCIKNKLKPEFSCVQTGDVPPWMAKKFNLKEDEVKSIWESMPMAVKESIMRTLIFRAERIPHTNDTKNVYYEL